MDTKNIMVSVILPEIGYIQWNEWKQEKDGTRRLSISPWVYVKPVTTKQARSSVG